MSTHSLQTAAAEEDEPQQGTTREARDSASLEILVKSLLAGLAALITARFGAQAAVVAAVLATLAAEGVRQLVKRRNWGIKRVGFLVALTVALGSFDSKIGRAVRKSLGNSAGALHVFAGGAGQVALTTAVATTIALSATVAVPEVADRVHGGNSVALGGARTFDLSAGEVGTLRFDARVGERVFVEMVDATTGTTTLSLETPSGETVASTYAYPYLDTTRLPETGTYRAIVDPSQTNSGRATVRVLRVPPDVVETVGLSKKPRPVNLSMTTGQSAEVRFEGAAGERVFVEMTNATTGTTTLSLESPTGEALTSTYSYPFLDTTRLPETGTYRAVVDPWQTNSGRATVRVLRVPQDVVETVDVSKKTRPVNLSLTTGQSAEVRFEGAAGERVFVEMTNATTGTTMLTLESPSGQSLASTYAYPYLDTTRLPETGTYRAIVDPWQTNSGRATLRVDRVVGE